VVKVGEGVPIGGSDDKSAKIDVRTRRRRKERPLGCRPSCHAAGLERKRRPVKSMSTSKKRREVDGRWAMQSRSGSGERKRYISISCRTPGVPITTPHRLISFRLSR